MTEHAELSLEEAARAIGAGDLSPTDLLNAVLTRIERVEPTIQAYASYDAERAHRDVATLTQKLTKSGPRSPLHGIPFAIKDVIDVDGLPTRAGSHVLDDEPIPSDAPVIE